MRAILAIPFAVVAVIIAGLGFVCFGTAALFNVTAQAISGDE
jgi:hypothetical protein